MRKSGIYRARTFERKADAKAWGSDVERAVDSGSAVGTIRAPKGMTLADLIDAYLGQVKTGRTIVANLTRIKTRIGRTSINRLSTITLRDYVESRKADGADGSTLAGDLSNLSSVLKWGQYVRNLDLDADLAKHVRQALAAERIDTRSRERTRIPTQSELEQLVAYFEGNPRQIIPMGLITRFGAASAMRLGEITRIRIEDISHNDRSVIIRERKDPQRKTRNDQEVPLVGKAWHIARSVAQGRSDGRLFPYSPDSASAAFTRAVRACGIEDLHFHDLRHLAITELFRAGLSIELVAIVSGHKDWKHLKRYTQLGAQDVHAALGDRL